MTTHWLHVSLSWGIALAVFIALAWAAAARHCAAKRALERLG